MSTQRQPEPRAIGTARAVLAALIVAGVRHLVICPGSRSAPLAYAAAEAEAAGRLELHVRIDERSAGFMALGLAQATGVPAAVAATSGSAIGQMLPAVMEANHTGTPLLVLSADRPDELHGTGASQTTEQKNLFGAQVRAALNVAAGQHPGPAVEAALHALRGSAAVPAGPVQLNLQFRDPLTPEDDSRIDAQPWTAVPAGRWPDTDKPPRWGPVGGLAARRTVVVAGHGAGPAAERFAALHGLPLFAEPSSNARHGANAIGHYRLLLAEGTAHIERVVLFGRPTLSRPVARLLADERVESVIWEPVRAPWYGAGRRRERPEADPAALQRFAGTAPAGWLQAWQLLDRQAASLHAELSAQDGRDHIDGAAVTQELWAAGSPRLLLGSSNIVRDADLAAVPAARPAGTVHANRGLAGIDGTIATALGLAIGSGQRTVAAMGDITFAHDAGSLLWTPGEATPTVDVVVYNDGGGAIFSTLEHGQVDAEGRYGNSVERLFATPQRMDLAALAAGYGWRYHLAGDRAALRELLAAPEAGVLRLIEVRAPRAQLRERNLRLAERVAALPWPGP